MQIQLAPGLSSLHGCAVTMDIFKYVKAQNRSLLTEEQPCKRLPSSTAIRNNDLHEKLLFLLFISGNQSQREDGAAALQALH